MWARIQNELIHDWWECQMLQQLWKEFPQYFYYGYKYMKVNSYPKIQVLLLDIS